MLREFIKEKKVVIIGANLSAAYITAYLRSSEVSQVTIVDPRTEEIVKRGWIDYDEWAEQTEAQVEFGEYQIKTFEEAQMIIGTQGQGTRHEFIEAARLRGAKIISETELVSQVVTKPITAVVGTNGKSTTAALIEMMLQTSGRKVFANVDRPLASLLKDSELDSYDHFIFSVDAYQLEGVETFAPEQIVFMNLEPEDMSYFGSFENYMFAMQRIFNNFKQTSHCIFNGDDINLQVLKANLQCRKTIFSKVPCEDHDSVVSFTRSHVSYKTADIEKSFNLSKIRLRGEHNRYNIMAAIAASYTLGVSDEAVFHTLDNFKTLKHRLKFVKRFNSVAFYDDSSSTNVSSLHVALESFTEPIILIVGGDDREADFSTLCPIIRQRVKNLVLVGEAKERVNRILGDYTETFIVGTLEEATMIAYQKSRSGDVVLFSPACAPCSFLKEVGSNRGDYFKSLIEKIIKPRKQTIVI